MNSTPKNLSEFQKNYSAHIRSPSTVPCPEGIPLRRSKVYEELLFNNTQGFVEKCFPVTTSLLTEAQWLHLVQGFFKEWSCHTPYFSQIPFEFIQFINGGPSIEERLFPKGLPVWLGSLLHYEWVELKVELSDVEVKQGLSKNKEQSILSANPTLENAQYDWPVHRISKEFIPTETTPTYLLVYRTPEHAIKFIEVNAFTSTLIKLFEDNPRSAKDALMQLSDATPNLSHKQALQFGLPMIDDFVDQDILIFT